MAKSFPNTGATVGLAADRTALTSPFAGMQFFETDTKRNWLYNGSTWIPDDGVFTTEAVRDAAITSPTEGMQAYLTAPTVPAALGTARLPSGITTIYNGSVWVCTTPVGSEILTNETTSSTSYVDLATVGPRVTLVTGTTALISFSSFLNLDPANEAGYISIAVSGASTIAASNDIQAEFYLPSTTAQGTFGRTLIIGGLTAGTNTFKMQYRVNTGTIEFLRRELVVTGIA